MNTETKKQNAYFEARGKLRAYLEENFASTRDENSLVSGAVCEAMPDSDSELLELISESYNADILTLHVSGQFGDVLREVAETVLHEEATDMLTDLEKGVRP